MNGGYGGLFGYREGGKAVGDGEARGLGGGGGLVVGFRLGALQGGGQEGQHGAEGVYVGVQDRVVPDFLVVAAFLTSVAS